MENIVERARLFAFEKHNGQKRRDGIRDYIVHPEKVASIVSGDIHKAVAWLHDTLEDTNTTYIELENEFGPMIAQTVFILTHTIGEPYFDYIARIKKNPNAIKVKIADIVANLSDVPTEKQIKKYYTALTFLLLEN